VWGCQRTVHECHVHPGCTGDVDGPDRDDSVDAPADNVPDAAGNAAPHDATAVGAADR
jgi:hypothetical protein